MQQRVQRLLAVGARLPSSWLRLGMIGLLLLLICQQLAVWTWRVLLPTQPVVNTVSLSPAHAKTTSAQTAAYTLFGRSPRATSLKPVPEGVLEGDIPVSSLQLTVTGILASQQTDRAIVIIAKDGRQFSRGVGDAVPGYEARIVTISADRIVLEHQGRYEALYLYRDEANTRNEVSPRDNVSTNHSNSASKASTTALGAVRNSLKSQPMKVMEYLSIVPLMKENALAGYRLNPGKKTELFYRLGLHDNDLAVALNGMDLRDAEQGQQAMAQLPQLTDLTLTIERDGQRQDITLTLDGVAEDESEQHAGRDEP